MKYYIAGLQRSGTNFLQKLITENFNEFSHGNASHSTPIWKHHVEYKEGFKDKIEEAGPYAVWFLIYKNPYTWVESVCNRNMADYQRTQKMFGDPRSNDYGGLLYGTNKINVLHLAKTWNQWVTNWIINPNDVIGNKRMIKYERLLDDDYKHSLLDDISTSLDLKRKYDYWAGIDPGSVSQSPRFSQDMIDYYKNVNHRLPNNVIDIINEHISDHCFNATGYARL